MSKDFKMCTKCGVTYENPVEHFNKCVNYKDGLYCYCKNCVKIINRKYKEKIKNKQTTSEISKRGVDKTRRKVYLKNRIINSLRTNKDIQKLELCVSIHGKTVDSRYYTFEVNGVSKNENKIYVIQKGGERIRGQANYDRYCDDYLSACYEVYKQNRYLDILFYEIDLT